MARERKFRLKFQSDSGVFYQINIFDNEALNSNLYEPNVGSDGFSLTYQTKDNDRFTGLIPSELKFDIFIENAAQQNEINLIKASEYGRWQLEIQRANNDVEEDYSLYWAGNVLNDINPEQDKDYPRSFRLTAVCGLAPLQDVPFNQDVGYQAPSTYRVLQYFRYALSLQVDTGVFWGVTDTYIATFVDWTTSGITHQADRDPLVYSRFNFMAFVELGDNGVKTYKSAFELLDGICKAFGMRCFLAEGRWNLVQVNYYDNWTSGNTHFYRYYYKGNDVLGSPDASGSIFGVVGEGSNIKRLGNNTFDYLPVLKEVVAEYDQINAYNLPFIWFANNDNTAVQYNPNFNEIPIWNGYRFINTIYSGADYDFNKATNDKLVIYLGNVTALTGATLQFNRTFNAAHIGDGFFPSSTDTEDVNNQLKITIVGRFRLDDGGGNVRYCRLRPNGDSWNTNVNNWSVGVTWYQYLYGATQYGGAGWSLNCFTNEIPFDGDLYLDFYATAQYDNFVSATENVSATSVQATDTDADEIIIYSQPNFNSGQGINYLIDGNTSSIQFVKSKNAPGGTPLVTGDIYNIDRLFIGSGGDGVGNVETYNFSTASWETDAVDWKAFNTGTGRTLTRLLTEQILDGQTAGSGVFNGDLKIKNNFRFTYFYGITIDGSDYMFGQCTFNANKDTWSGEWYEIDLSGQTQQVSVGNLIGILNYEEDDIIYNHGMQ